ncbi:MAG TPA: ABC transporter substrate-binding protein [Stellaceae bacterium]|nr:ABC transporter substrate-binding protein [Stellaceae bacterium]
MRRRDVITLLAAVLATPCAARAQPPPRRARLGYVWIGAAGSEHSTLDGLRQGLAELSYVEGRHFVIEDRYADSQPERIPVIVTDLLRSGVDLFLAPGNVVVQAAMQQTAAVPIVATAPDLFASGFVASLAHPGGNVTGISLAAGAAIAEKWLELAKEIVPHLTAIAWLGNSGIAYADSARRAASTLKTELLYFGARNDEELNRALAAIEMAQVGALILESDPWLVSKRAEIIGFAARRRLPAIYGNPDYMPSGGLLAYATNIREAWRRLATYVDKILNGARPNDLPVEQATRFELIINLKTAKALDLEIPGSLLARADEVIE